MLFLRSYILEINTSHSKYFISQLFCTVNVFPHKTQVKLQTNIAGESVPCLKAGFQDAPTAGGFLDKQRVTARQSLEPARRSHRQEPQAAGKLLERTAVKIHTPKNHRWFLLTLPGCSEKSETRVSAVRSCVQGRAV